MKHTTKLLSLALLTMALPFAQANATPLADPVGDFLATYGGPHAADLDVVSTEVILYNNAFYLSATMNGMIGTTPGFFVWGFDRGTGSTTSSFASLGLPNIVFDSLVFINQDGSGRVTLLGAGGTTTNFGAGTFGIAGNTFTAVLPTSLLPSKGFAFSQYTQNLWPRWSGTVGAGQTNISDFAPNATMAGVTVPEPASLSLLGMGLFALGAARRKRAK